MSLVQDPLCPFEPACVNRGYFCVVLLKGKHQRLSWLYAALRTAEVCGFLTLP